MKNYKNLLSLLILLPALIGCSKQTTNYHKILNHTTSNISVFCEIEKIVYINVEDILHTYLKGNIKVRNISSFNISINLKDFLLVVNDSLKGKLYIDSIASIIIKDETMTPQEELNKNIYWVFDKKIQRNEINDIKIIIEMKNKPELIR